MRWELHARNVADVWAAGMQCVHVLQLVGGCACSCIKIVCVYMHVLLLMWGPLCASRSADMGGYRPLSNGDQPAKLHGVAMNAVNSCLKK